jgi:uncharacterized protein YecE (DUF72 family)
MPASLIRLGTSAFTAEGWKGVFYPENMKPADYLTHYALNYDTVELDSTFYRTPTVRVVEGWYNKTPKGFLFAAKVPQIITHEKVLVDCESDVEHFISTMDVLKEKLGPLLFQFGYFNKKAFVGVNDFLARLIPFLKKLPKDHQYAVEIRNKNWIVPQFIEALRERKIAFALVDHAWMPRPTQIFEKLDPITADFTYIRWLGDRKGIEQQTKTWNQLIINRRTELEEWVDICRKIAKRKIQILAFANNHYAGYGPGTVDAFRFLWNRQAKYDTLTFPSPTKSMRLFD